MTQTSRQRWMQLLAEADVQDLKTAFDRLEKPVACTCLITPETGMVMVQGKTDGTGTPFCIGEMTVTRCMDQAQGYAMVPGSDPDHARLAALFDALLQIPSFHDPLMTTLIKTLETKACHNRQTLAREVSDTTVEFFTLTRGE
ncbi:MAG: phosphonate C-P lyase system protein PhnG [Desulfotignum sp.]|nr:phosphonate C-P lyase system protein PhnG [Desulfotignum sp.]